MTKKTNDKAIQKIKAKVTFDALVFQCMKNFGYLLQRKNNGFFDSAYKYRCIIENTVEFLEVAICGSVGGFDFDYIKAESQQHTDNKRYDWKYLMGNLIPRFLWIMDKYSIYNDNTKVSSFGKFSEILKGLEK